MDKPNKDGATMQIVKTAKEIERCSACDGERVLWLMSEFPIPCPACNENSPEFKRKHLK